jgi:hypothetical protein
VIAAATVGCAAVLNACGGTARKTVAGRLGEHSIAAGVAPPPTTLISGREIAALPRSSPRRALLSLWSSLQWQVWPEALSYYKTALVKQIGVTNLLQAWKLHASTYRVTKPRVEGETVQGGRVTIRYVLSGSNTVPTPSSITWEKASGKWTVYYDSSLDTVLRVWAQTEAQQALGASANKLSSRAITAGVHAGEIQDHYLATHLAGEGR